MDSTIHFWGTNSEWFWAFLQVLVIPVTLYFVWRQLRSQNLSNQISLLNEIENTWRSDEMKRYRAHVCSSALDCRINAEEEAVLWFFEKIGIYCKKGVLDKGIVWEYYSYFATRYYAHFLPSINTMIKEHNDSSYFENFKYLNSILLKYSEKKGIKEDLSNKAVEALLKSEKRLV